MFFCTFLIVLLSFEKYIFESLAVPMELMRIRCFFDFKLRNMWLVQESSSASAYGSLMPITVSVKYASLCFFDRVIADFVFLSILLWYVKMGLCSPICNDRSK